MELECVDARDDQNTIYGLLQALIVNALQMLHASKVARKNPVDRREVDIGKRLADAREEALVSQTALAVRIQISRERLVKYEAGMVPLRFWPGLSACRALGINQHWLATGLGPPSPYLALDWKQHLEGVDKRAVFSKVYDEQLKVLLEPRALIEAALADLQGVEPSLDELYRSVTNAWLQSICAADAGEFVIRLSAAAKKIISDIEGRPRAAEQFVKRLLTNRSRVAKLRRLSQ